MLLSGLDTETALGLPDVDDKALHPAPESTIDTQPIENNPILHHLKI